MRHLATLIAAVVIAPIAWLLLAFGQEHSVQLFADGSLQGSNFIRPVLVLAAAGVLLGLIATLRFSPVGAVVTGVAYAASYLLLLVVPGTVQRLFHHSISISGRPADMATPVHTGTAMLLGGLLLVAVFSRGRWRRWPRPGEAPDDLWPPQEPSYSAGAGGGLAGGSGLGTEPEFQARYSSRPQQATVGSSSPSWVASLHSGHEGR